MDILYPEPRTALDKTNELGDNISEYTGKFPRLDIPHRNIFSSSRTAWRDGAYNLDKVNDAITRSQPDWQTAP